MSRLIVPHRAAAEQAVSKRADNPIIGKLNYELQQMDPHLQVVWIGERFPEGIIPGASPGRWHLRRNPPDGIDSYWPVEGPDGEYRDLGMDLVEKMKAADLWKPGAVEELNRRKYRRAAREAKEKALLAEQADDMVKEDIRAADRMRGDGGMTKRRPK